MLRSLVTLVFFLDSILSITSQRHDAGSLWEGMDQEERIWNQMSDEEKMLRLKDLQRRIFSDIGNKGGGNSGYGAPPSNSYSVPTYDAPAPSYNQPQPSYNPPSKPSYNQPSKPSYGGGKGPGKVIEIPIPNINLPKLPNPIEFKAGVLRSKGRIASGLLHTKAGLLRAGANILAQKANALDRFAQAIPGLNSNIINSMGGGGGGGYGAPPSNTYGAPPPSNTYGAPPPSNGYGAPQGPLISGPNQNSQGSRPSFSNNNFNSNSLGNSFSSGVQAPDSYSGAQNSNSNNNNFVNSVQPVQNNFRPSNTDSYGSPQGSTITGSLNGNSFSGGNTANIPVGTSLSFGNSNNGLSTYSSNNGFSSSNNNGFSNSNSGFSNNGNSFSSSNNGGFNDLNQNSGSSSSNGFNNNNGFNDDYGFSNNNGFSSSSSNGLSSLNNNANGDIISTNNGFNNNGNGYSFSTGNDEESTLEQTGVVNSNSIRSIRPGDRTKLTLKGLDSISDAEKLLRLESREGGQGRCSAESSSLSRLIKDIFMGNEIIPDVIDEPPMYPLDLTYKTIRTFPGMHLTADMTRFKPMLKWPAQPDSLYTVVLSNLDINSRRNRTLSEFWHWFVANIPGDSVDDGEVIFDLLFPLVLPEGDGDHRYGYFVFEQPRELDYRDEGGPTDSCSPQMSNGRGPFKSTKNFMKKYDLTLTAATFIVMDTNEASMEIACEWQKCIGNTINLVSPLQCN
ncbi:putative uncharacterized protein DDB_G0282133 isoform X2 [Eurytemora carolleeae]|uniref:putative uncharacterized protein DDB_G0282133 isoform X2 n=1 Tax=Eurytemora carolleeae TaxID=1294199 RepID=UPI000C7922E4|nr:putative uncharacterized protein DDB_G0282133 isoform X2 [Eurytemora carolleeae]|eukprot:XP_023334365.1 putative uncharacterized protein DDB_G0282133 isoform X2 [Eurytemora affinis]